MKVELTVLGFIAMLIWCLRQIGVFGYESPHDYSLGWFHLFPDNGTDMLHMVEDVHMQMFLAMIFYFLMVFYLVRRTLIDILQTFENAELHMLMINNANSVEEEDLEHHTSRTHAQIVTCEAEGIDPGSARPKEQMTTTRKNYEQGMGDPVVASENQTEQRQPAGDTRTTSPTYEADQKKATTSMIPEQLPSFGCTVGGESSSFVERTQKSSGSSCQKSSREASGDHLPLYRERSGESSNCTTSTATRNCTVADSLDQLASTTGDLCYAESSSFSAASGIVVGGGFTTTSSTSAVLAGSNQNGVSNMLPTSASALSSRRPSLNKRRPSQRPWEIQNVHSALWLHDTSGTTTSKTAGGPALVGDPTVAFYLKCKRYILHYTETIYGIRVLTPENVYLEKYFQRVIHEMITQLVEFGFRCWVLVLHGAVIFLVLCQFVSRWYLISSAFFLLITLLAYLHYAVAKPGRKRIEQFDCTQADDKCRYLRKMRTRSCTSHTLMTNSNTGLAGLLGGTTSTGLGGGGTPSGARYLIGFVARAVSAPVRMLRSIHSGPRDDEQNGTSFEVDSSSFAKNARNGRGAAAAADNDRKRLLPFSAATVKTESTTKSSTMSTAGATSMTSSKANGNRSSRLSSTTTKSPKSSGSSKRPWLRYMVTSATTSTAPQNALLTGGNENYGNSYCFSWVRKVCSSFQYKVKHIHSQYSTEVVAVRVIQALAFFICYACTRSLCSRRLWTKEAEMQLLHGEGDLPTYIGLLFCTLGLLFGVLPRIVPQAYLIMALPPYFDKENQHVFTNVLEDYPYGFGGDFFLKNPTHPSVSHRFQKTSWGGVISATGRHPNLVYRKQHRSKRSRGGRKKGSSASSGKDKNKRKSSHEDDGALQNNDHDNFQPPPSAGAAASQREFKTSTSFDALGLGRGEVPLSTFNVPVASSCTGASDSAKEKATLWGETLSNGKQGEAAPHNIDSSESRASYLFTRTKGRSREEENASQLCAARMNPGDKSRLSEPGTASAAGSKSSFLIPGILYQVAKRFGRVGSRFSSTKVHQLEDDEQLEAPGLRGRQLQQDGFVSHDQETNRNQEEEHSADLYYRHQQGAGLHSSQQRDHYPEDPFDVVHRSSSSDHTMGMNHKKHSTTTPGHIAAPRHNSESAMTFSVFGDDTEAESVFAPAAASRKIMEELAKLERINKSQKAEAMLSAEDGLMTRENSGSEHRELLSLADDHQNYQRAELFPLEDHQLSDKNVDQAAATFTASAAVQHQHFPYRRSSSLQPFPMMPAVQEEIMEQTTREGGNSLPSTSSVPSNERRNHDALFTTTDVLFSPAPPKKVPEGAEFEVLETDPTGMQIDEETETTLGAVRNRDVEAGGSGKILTRKFFSTDLHDIANKAAGVDILPPPSKPEKNLTTHQASRKSSHASTDTRPTIRADWSRSSSSLRENNDSVPNSNYHSGSCSSESLGASCGEGASTVSSAEGCPSDCQNGNGSGRLEEQRNGNENEFNTAINAYPSFPQERANQTHAVSSGERGREIIRENETFFVRSRNNAGAVKKSGSPSGRQTTTISAGVDVDSCKTVQQGHSSSGRHQNANNTIMPLLPGALEEASVDGTSDQENINDVESSVVLVHPEGTSSTRGIKKKPKDHAFYGRTKNSPCKTPNDDDTASSVSISGSTLLPGGGPPSASVDQDRDELLFPSASDTERTTEGVVVDPPSVDVHASSGKDHSTTSVLGRTSCTRTRDEEQEESTSLQLANVSPLSSVNSSLDHLAINSGTSTARRVCFTRENSLESCAPAFNLAQNINAKLNLISEEGS
ncbi:unnamed protein product [Amoebophrya sp. A120]|nr:unnamed protein product [Amoebophrya sp. A120]|eukprot:GSA120T00024998001.1